MPDRHARAARLDRRTRLHCGNTTRLRSALGVHSNVAWPRPSSSEMAPMVRPQRRTSAISWLGILISCQLKLRRAIPLNCSNAPHSTNIAGLAPDRAASGVSLRSTSHRGHVDHPFHPPPVPVTGAIRSGGRAGPCTSPERPVSPIAPIRSRRPRDRCVRWRRPVAPSCARAADGRRIGSRRPACVVPPADLTPRLLSQ